MRVLATQSTYHRTDPRCKETGPMGSVALQHGESMSKTEAQSEGYEPCGVCFPEETSS
jgi:hypothetical protein